MAARVRSRVLLAAVLALFACDETWTLRVAVNVDPVAEVPAGGLQILVAFDDGGNGFVAFRVGWVCGPGSLSAAPRFWTGAAPPGAVDVWLAPGDGQADHPCGPLPEPERVEPAPLPPSDGPGRASAPVAAPVGCGGTSEREASVALELG